MAQKEQLTQICSVTKLPFFEKEFQTGNSFGTKCSECGEILFEEAR